MVAVLWRTLFAAIATLAMPCLASAEPISGRVLDYQSDAPIVSAQVRIQKLGSPTMLADLDTDSTGQFRGPDLPGGEYVIGVSKTNFMTSQSSVHTGSRITVHLIRYGVITGRVTTLSGQPVAGARLVALIKQPGATMHKLSKSGAVTDSRGQYRMFGLPLGQYCVAVSYDGPASSTGSDLRVFPNDFSPQIFNITAGEEFRNIDFILTEPKLYRISGRIDGPPPGETGFSATLIARDRPYISIAHLRTERDGRFSFEGIPAGSYDIVVAGPVNGWGARQVIVGPGALFGRIGIEISGQSVEDVSIPVTKGQTVTVLVRSSGGGCSGGQIRLISQQDQGVFDPAVVPAKLNQAVGITDVPPGRYNVLFSTSARDCYQTKPVVVNASVADVEAPFVVFVGRAGSITGVLTGTASLFEITVVDLSGEMNEQRSAIPDQQARFVFDNLPPGRYRVSARSKAAPKNEVSLEVNVEVATAQEVHLNAPATEGLKP